MKKLNRDVKRRDEIIFGSYNPNAYPGGIRYYEKMGVDKLQQLFDEGFVDPLDSQNYAPTAAEFLQFLHDWPDFYVHGYVVSIERDDYRVTIEGVERAGTGTMTSDEERRAFIEMFRMADEFDFDHGYCWYD